MKAVQRTIRTVAILLISSAVIAMPAVAAAAANTNEPKSTVKGITLSPPLKEVVLGPGLIQAETEITLTNTTDKDMYATLRLVDFASNEFGDLSFSALGASTSKYALAKWMDLPLGDSVTIPSGKSTDIPVHINNSKDLAPGGHYGAVIATISTAPGSSAPNTVTLKQEVVSLLFVKKTGGETYGLELETLKSNGGDNFPDEVDMRFKNTGNVHVVPRGYIEVTDSKGKLISKGIINPESTIVMPDGSRHFITILQPVTNPGRSGNYTITAYYRYDGQDKFSSKSITYTKKFANLRQLAALGAVLTGVIIFVLAVLVRRRGRARKIRQ